MTPPAFHPLLKDLLRDGSLSVGLEPGMLGSGLSTLIQQADEQGILPLLWRQLSASYAPTPLVGGSDVQERLAGIVAWNLNLAGELAAILRAFEATQVACIPLRGLTLAQRLYDDWAMRPTSDIDLLVKKQDLDRVRAILADLGFHEMTRRSSHFADTYDYSLEFTKQNHGVILVEPHWSIAYPPFVTRTDMDHVWARSVPARAFGIPVRFLSPGDLFLHLCYHLMHWQESAPALWYFDLDRLIRREGTDLDWPRVVLSARQSGQALFVLRVIQALLSLFETPVPDDVQKELSRHETVPRGQPAPGFLERHVTRLLAGGSQLRGREEFSFFFTLRDPRSQLHYGLSLLFPSPDYMRTRYGAANSPQLAYYYAARFLKLCWEGLCWLKDLSLVICARGKS